MTTPLTRTAISPARRGRLAREVKTKKGVPKQTIISVTDARLIFFQWAKTAHGDEQKNGNNRR
jgi:hypothetical protein